MYIKRGRGGGVKIWQRKSMEEFKPSAVSNCASLHIRLGVGKERVQYIPSHKRTAKARAARSKRR